MKRELFMRKESTGYFASGVLVGIATGLGLVGRGHFAASDFVMLFLLIIAVAGAAFGRGPSLLASALSVVAYDYFFIPPFHTLTVADERHLLTFATMFVVGLLISELMSRLRRHQREAIEREKRTAALYSLSSALGASVDAEQIARVTAQHCVDSLGGAATVMLFGEAGASMPLANARAPVGLETDAPNVTRFSLVAGEKPCGLLTLTSSAPPDAEQHQLLQAFATQAGYAIDRIRLAKAARTAELRARTEEMRSSLLSAVSHDLRTPLGAITGAATTLRDAPAELGPVQRADLADTICVEAERLERFVVNLLEMTKVEAGALRVRREWVPLEEPIGSALTRLEAVLGGRPVYVPLPLELPLVSVDPVLMEQVFYNLLENATKYTPPNTPLHISTQVEVGRFVVEIADEGPGLPPGSEDLVFEKFFRGEPKGVGGAGLGLAICRGIVHAHGGTITAENRTEGGAVFRMVLPLEKNGPVVPTELDARGEGT